jgi:hypothetical protein
MHDMHEGLQGFGKPVPGFRDVLQTSQGAILCLTAKVRCQPDAALVKLGGWFRQAEMRKYTASQMQTKESVFRLQGPVRYCGSNGARCENPSNSLHARKWEVPFILIYSYTAMRE